MWAEHATTTGCACAPMSRPRNGSRAAARTVTNPGIRDSSRFARPIGETVVEPVLALAR